MSWFWIFQVYLNIAVCSSILVYAVKSGHFEEAHHICSESNIKKKKSQELWVADKVVSFISFCFNFFYALFLRTNSLVANTNKPSDDLNNIKFDEMLNTITINSRHKRSVRPSVHIVFVIRFFVRIEISIVIHEYLWLICKIC